MRFEDPTKTIKDKGTIRIPQVHMQKVCYQWSEYESLTHPPTKTKHKIHISIKLHHNLKKKKKRKRKRKRERAQESKQANLQPLFVSFIILTCSRFWGLFQTQGVYSTAKSYRTQKIEENHPRMA